MPRLIAALLVAMMAVTVFFAARAFIGAFGVGFETPAAGVVSVVFVLAVWRKVMGFANRINTDEG